MGLIFDLFVLFILDSVKNRALIESITVAFENLCCPLLICKLEVFFPNFL